MLNNGRAKKKGKREQSSSYHQRLNQSRSIASKEDSDSDSGLDDCDTSSDNSSSKRSPNATIEVRFPLMNYSFFIYVIINKTVITYKVKRKQR